jgi:hypothetical protein
MMMKNNYQNKKIVIKLTGLFGIALALAFMILPNNHSVLSQQQNSTNPSGNSSSSSNNKTVSISMTPNTQQQQQNPYSMSSMTSGLQNQNWTGSISLFSPIIDAFKSKIHTTLNDATTNAINAVSGGGGAGSNASAGAVAAFIHPENGFLVYDVFVLDSSNNIHRVVVDPGNGKVLSNQQMSMMEMMSMAHPSMEMMMGPHGMGLTGPPFPPNGMMGPPPPPPPGTGMMSLPLSPPNDMMMTRHGMMMMGDLGMGMMGPALFPPPGMMGPPPPPPPPGTGMMGAQDRGWP